MTESEILWNNAKHLGVNLIKFFDEFGFQVSEDLINTFGKNKTYSVILGLSGNAADGMAVAFHLTCAGAKKVNVYLFGRTNQIKDPIASEIFLELTDLTKDHKNLEIKLDCYKDDVIQPDIIIEAISGTGLTGTKLTKRYFDVVKRFSHFNSKLVAIDTPTFHYKPDVTYSLMYPKTENAKVVLISLPTELENYCGFGEQLALWKPKDKTHKLKNGSLLFIDSLGEVNDEVKKLSKEYFTNISIFNFEPKSKNLKSKIQNLNAEDLGSLIEKAEVILIGDVIENIISFATINYILSKYPDKKFVLFGNVVNFIDLEKLKDLTESAIILSKQEIKNLTNKNIEEGKLKRLAKEFRTEILLAGGTTYLYGSNESLKMVRKSFTSIESLIIELATKTASYSTKNGIWLSLRAAMA